MAARGLRVTALAFAFLVLLAGAPQAEGPWSGLWDTRWRDGGATLDLHQDGSRVTGAYPLYGGTIEATASGRQLTGRWAQGARGGDFVFTLGRDGTSFAGRFASGEWWTGGRLAAPIPLPPSDLSNPRAALQTLLVASNVVRGGLPEAVGVAAGAVDFGPGGDMLLPGERFRQATALFELIDLTTVRLWTVPDRAPGEAMEVVLEQAGTDVLLPLTLTTDAGGAWRVRMPSADALAGYRHALLARSGGVARPADAYKRLQSPRDTMRAFLEGMRNWDAGGAELALSTLDLSEVPEVRRAADGTLAAHYLRRVLGKIGLVGLQSIPNEGAPREAYMHFTHPEGRVVIAPAGEGADAAWKFTPTTVDRIDEVFDAIETLPPLEEIARGRLPHSDFFALRSFVAGRAPALLERAGLLEYWQIIGIALLFVAMTLVGLLGGWIVMTLLQRLLGRERVANPIVLGVTAGIVTAALLGSAAMSLLGVPEHIRQYTQPVTGVLVSLAAATLAWKLVGLLDRLLTTRAERTESTTDDMLLLLGVAASRLGIVVAAALAIAQFLSVPTAGVLAGLGIGGLAFAFASRETLSNVFGAGILVSDRPFRRGDWIVTSDVEGSVERVGIRSTRVRTAQDSVAVVPNGKLADSMINNMGTRRHRLMKSQIVIAGGLDPKRLETFVAAMRDRIAGDPAFVRGRTDLGVTGISPAGVEIDLVTYLDVPSLRAEREARHALMLDILRLAHSQGLSLVPEVAPAEPVSRAA